MSPEGSERSNFTRHADLLRSGWGQGVCVSDFNNYGFAEHNLDKSSGELTLKSARHP